MILYYNKLIFIKKGSFSAIQIVGGFQIRKLSFRCAVKLGHVLTLFLLYIVHVVFEILHEISNSLCAIVCREFSVRIRVRIISDRWRIRH